MHVLIPILIYHLLCVLNSVLPLCIPHFPEVSRGTYKVEQACCLALSNQINPYPANVENMVSS